MFYFHVNKKPFLLIQGLYKNFCRETEHYAFQSDTTLVQIILLTKSTAVYLTINCKILTKT